MPGIVLDASFAVALVMPDEAKPAASMIALFERDGAIVPSIWPLEVANTLLNAERRRWIGSGSVRQILNDLSQLPISLDPETAARAWDAILVLASRHRLTSYDAAYLELAKRLGLPLATLDGDLRKAAAAEGVEI